MNLDSLRSLNIIQLILSGTIQNEICRNDTYKVFNGILQLKPWALRMADATGKISAGILEGNIQNLGSMDECLAAKTEEDSGTFTGKYCLVQFQIPLQSHGIKNAVTKRWGTCIPSSCTAGDLQAVLSDTLPLHGETNELLCQVREDRPYETQEMVTIGILCFITLLTILSTIYDYFNSSGHSNKYLLLFSLKTKVKNLFDTTTCHGSLNSLHGMRVVAMFFIIWAHMYWAESRDLVSVNATRWLDWLSDWPHLWLTSLSLPVDAFFVFSGTLVSYSFMNGLSKGKKFNLPLHFIHRYLRLTPALAITLLFNATLFSRLGSGPLWKPYSHRTEEECQNNWWKYLLFVNNWFHMHQCMVQTWYIAADAQLYFLSPVLLFPLQYWPRFGLGLTFAALIAAFFTSFGISYVTEQHADIYRGVSPKISLRLYGTYHRITPWLIGFIVGYFLHKYQHLATFQKLEELRNRRVTWRKTLLAVLISAICIVLFCGPILAVHPFLQPDYQYDAFASAAYRSLSHVIFALSVVLAVAACITGYGGLLDMLFSWKFYVPISRLTYSIYLIHMTIVQSYVYSKMTPGYISDSNMIMAAVPIALLTLILSALLYLMVEQPVVTLERLLLRRQDPESPALLVIQSRDGGHKSPSCEIPDITPGNVPNGHIRQPVGDEYTLSVVDLRI